MFDDLTLKQFLDNPYGKGASFANKNIIMEGLTQRYNALINEHGTFKVTPYFDNGDYYALVEIPSEKHSDLHYQVVVQFTDINGDFENGMVLNKYDVRFFSNSPSFTFTFAHTYDVNNRLVIELKDKFDEKVFELEPKTRNPDEILGYEKTVVYASMFIIEHKDFYLEKRNYARKSNLKTLLKDIKTDRQILDEYKRLDKIARDEKRKVREAEKDLLKEKKPKGGQRSTSGIKKTTTTKSTKRITGSKNSERVGRTKKVGRK